MTEQRRDAVAGQFQVNIEAEITPVDAKTGGMLAFSFIVLLTLYTLNPRLGRARS